MAYEKRTSLYEALVRFGPDGMAGAHVKDLEEVIDTETGRPVAQTEGKARPVTVEEVGKYLTEAAADAVEKLAARENAFAAVRAEHEEACAAREAEIAQARADCEAERKEAAEAIEVERAKLATLRDKLASVAASVMSAV